MCLSVCLSVCVWSHDSNCIALNDNIINNNNMHYYI